MNILVNTSKQKKDVVKATTTKQYLKDFVGKTAKVTNLFKYQKPNAMTGELITNVVLETEHGWLFSQSPSVIETVDILLEGYETEEINDGIDIMIQSGKSNAGREFFYIDVL